MPVLLSFDPQTGKVSLKLDPSWWEFLIRKFAGKKEDTVLDYRTSHAKNTYAKSKMHWLEIPSDKGAITAPYEMVFDYRKRDPKSKSLGDFKKGESYTFPGELCPLKDTEIERRKAEKKLKKDNKPAVRVGEVTVTDQGISFLLQESWYYDQVGSNLSPDAKDAVEFVTSNSRDHGPESIRVTPRLWDMLQSGLNQELPSFAKSKLANTIGVAYGIKIHLKDGRLAVIRRLRSAEVDVYANMWHLPFSFALSHVPPLAADGAMEDLINPDLTQELEQETGLERSEIKITPLAFTRDLCRAGKPQFFFEIETNVDFEDLSQRMKKRREEYRGHSELLVLGDNIPADDKFDGSPELLAYLCLQHSI